MGRKSWAVLAVVGAIVLVGTQGSGARTENGDDWFRRGCSEATLRGAYGIQIQGTRIAPPSIPPAPPVPPNTLETVIGVIVRQYDGRGGFTQINNEKGSASGLGLMDRPGFGTYQVNEDCSGSHELHFPDAPVVVTDRFVIVDHGREVRSFVVSPPPVMVTGVSRKMGLW
jgi:hypothetical protein